MRKTGWRKRDAGSAMVEFTFSAFFMLVAMLTLMELCNAVYTYVVLSEAANEGMRYAIVHSTDAGFTTNVKNKVWTYAGNAFTISAPSSNVTVTVNCPDSGGTCPGSIPGRVQITASYPYVPFIGVISRLGGSSPTMTAYAESRFVY